MILIIDVTSTDTLRLRLLEKSKLCAHQIYRGTRQNLLLRLDQFLSAASMELENLLGLALVEGAGSFAALRQATAVLNTIALIKGLPVAGFDCRLFKSETKLWQAIAKVFSSRPSQRFLRPIYSGQPNIRK